MNLLLFRKTVIISNLTQTEIIKKLSEIVDSEQRFFFSYPNQAKKYTGKIDNKRFKIHKIIKGRNSFIPFIQGEISDNVSTRKIEFTMRLHFIVILFLLWVSGLVLYYFIKNNDYGGFLFLGLIFGMTIFFFNQECNDATADLKDIFTD